MISDFYRVRQTRHQQERSVVYRNPPQKSNPRRLGTPLRSDEFEVAYVGQRGTVALRWPDDLDIFEEVGAGRLTIARAKKRVATRRQLESELAEIERQEREGWL